MELFLHGYPKNEAKISSKIQNLKKY